MKILITGIAGFIGFHLARRFAAEGHEITGIDNLNTYYDIELKYGRLDELGIPFSSSQENNRNKVSLSSKWPKLRFIPIDLKDAESLRSLFKIEQFELVIHLAAQAGVRYSLTNPNVYITSNIQGFLNLLECLRNHPVKHLVYASSSSVYGLNRIQPFSEKHSVDQPASLYAVTKRSNELMAYSYAHLYGIPVTGLRFFTVYGPWGRPDMAPFLFTKAILEGQPIDVFNYGDMQRDFTYIDDIIEGVIRISARIPEESPELDDPKNRTGSVPARIYNIGSGKTIRLFDFISILESELGIKAKKNMLSMQDGDVPATWADCSALKQDTGYHPSTSLQDGIKNFVTWYRSFYA